MLPTTRKPRGTHCEAPSAHLMSTRAVAHLVAAIGRGEIDALVLPTPQGERVFTYWTDEHPYRVLIEAMSEGALTLSPDGTVLYCNSSFARIIGASLEKVIGSCLADLVVAEDRPKLASILAHGCRESARAELSIRSAGGQTVPVYISTQPLPACDCSRICAVVTDLTEVYEARQAQFRLAAIVETSGDAILSTTLEGSVLSWNRGAERLLGHRTEEIVGRSILHTFPVDRCEEFLRLLDKVKEGVAAENFEMEQLRQDGVRIDVVLTLSPIRDRQGKVIAASAIVRDNTVRKRAHRRLQCVLESAPDAIVVANHNGNIVLVNTQAETLFGFRREQMIGHSLTMLIPRCFHEFLGTWFQQDPYLRQPGSRHEVFAVRADGRDFPAEVSIGAVESEEGSLLCSSVRDISERFAFQQALREKNAQLQSALHAKDHFLATMSHELRTPLTGIIGFVGILLMKLSGPLTDPQVRQLELVRSSARHLFAIISDLLDLARIGAGKAPLQREQVCCQEAVEESVRELTATAEQKRIAITTTGSRIPILIQTDRRFLRQILSNLLSNAVKFTDQGTVRISILDQGVDPSRTVAIAISDTGIGIMPEDLSRLFIEFCRVQSTSADRREGTGLGLHLSQKLALLLGGRITVESEFGKGSTFTLTLPFTAPRE